MDTKQEIFIDFFPGIGPSFLGIREAENYLLRRCTVGSIVPSFWMNSFAGRKLYANDRFGYVIRHPDLLPRLEPRRRKENSRFFLPGIPTKKCKYIIPSEILGNLF